MVKNNIAFKIFAMVAILVLSTVFVIFAGKYANIGVNTKVEIQKEINEIKNTTVKLNELIALNKANETELEVDSSKVTNDEFIKMQLEEFLTITNDTYNAVDKTISHDDFVVVLNNDNSVNVGDAIIINLDIVATGLGYSYEISEGNYILTRQYSSMRLLVESGKKLPNFDYKVTKLDLDNLLILQFTTEKNTQDAYNILINSGFVVDIDSVIKVDGFDDYTATNLSETTDKYKFNSWGGNYMGFGEYNTYLKTQYKSLKEVCVVVVDTGINPNHVLLKDRMAEGSMAFCSGYSPSEWQDDSGHGTHVAGTIAELTPSNVKIISIKFIDGKRKGYSSMEQLAYKYISKLKKINNNIKVVNGSYGAKLKIKAVLEFFSFTLKDVINSNVICCYGAGNDSESADSFYPAAIEGALAVSAINEYGNLCSFSNYGSEIDFCAPGENIISADYRSEDGLTPKRGTSMATPHVAAAVACVASDPRFDTKDKIIDALKTAAVDIGVAGKDDKYGYGYIKLSKLIAVDGGQTANTKNYSYSLGIIADGVILNGENVGQVGLSYLNGSNVILKRIGKNVDVVTGIAKTASAISLKVVELEEYKFLGWYIGTSEDCQNGKFYSTSKEATATSLSETETNYIFAKFKRRINEVTVNLEFRDVAEYTAFGSYGAKINVTYYDTSGNLVVDEFEGGYKPSDQVRTYQVAYGYSVNIDVECVNDSVVDKVCCDDTDLASDIKTQKSQTTIYSWLLKGGIDKHYINVYILI